MPIARLKGKVRPSAAVIQRPTSASGNPARTAAGAAMYEALDSMAPKTPALPTDMPQACARNTPTTPCSSGTTVANAARRNQPRRSSARRLAAIIPMSSMNSISTPWNNAKYIASTFLMPSGPEMAPMASPPSSRIAVLPVNTSRRV